MCGSVCSLIFTYLMTVSCNTKLIDSIQTANAPGELGRPRSRYLSTAIARVNDGPLLLQLRDSILLTLSPRACNKLALKYENVDRIKLGPDAHARDERNEAQPLRTVCDDCRSARDEVANLQLSMNFLMNEKDTLASKKHLLEKKLDDERNKNVHLRSYNDTLRFDLSAVTTKTLELSIDKQMLEDEMEKILWKDNCKFLLPLKNGSISRKL